MFFSCFQKAPADDRTEEILPSASESQPEKGDRIVTSAAAEKPAAVAVPQEVEKLLSGSVELLVRVTKDSFEQPWGLVAEVVGDVKHLLIVSDIADGWVKDQHNKSATPGSHRFEKYDVITRVNGKTDAKAMKEEIKDSNNQLDILVVRPQTLTRVVKKDGKPLGMIIRHRDLGKAINVRSIKRQGSIREAGLDIQAGDFIVSVNGLFGKSMDLVEKMMSDEVLEFGIRRLAVI